MGLFRKTSKKPGHVRIPKDEAVRTASSFPDEVNRFCNAQVRRIIGQEHYPPYALFERLAKDAKYASRFLTAHNELVNALQSDAKKPQAIESFLKLGFGPEQVFETLISGTYLNQVDTASFLWVCFECRCVIGLIDQAPADLVGKDPHLAEWGTLATYFGLYMTANRVVCPKCKSPDYLTLKAQFLTSGLSLQSRIDEANKLAEKS